MTVLVTALVTGLMVVLGIAIGLCGVRIVQGPSGFDRALAFECVTLQSVGALILVSLLLRTDAFIDLALVVALLGFLVTMALAAFLEGTLLD